MRTGMGNVPLHLRKGEVRIEAVKRAIAFLSAKGAKNYHYSWMTDCRDQQDRRTLMLLHLELSEYEYRMKADGE